MRRIIFKHVIVGWLAIIKWFYSESAVSDWIVGEKANSIWLNLHNLLMHVFMWCRSEKITLIHPPIFMKIFLLKTTNFLNFPYSTIPSIFPYPSSHTPSSRNLSFLTWSYTDLYFLQKGFYLPHRTVFVCLGRRTTMRRQTGLRRRRTWAQAPQPPAGTKIWGRLEPWIFIFLIFLKNFPENHESISVLLPNCLDSAM